MNISVLVNYSKLASGKEREKDLLRQTADRQPESEDEKGMEETKWFLFEIFRGSYDSLIQTILLSFTTYTNEEFSSQFMLCHSLCLTYATLKTRSQITDIFQ